MKKTFLFIIGLMLSTMLYGPSVSAQDEPDDCQETLGSDEFHCTSQNVHDYCSLGNQVGRAVTNTVIDIYGSTYCDMVSDSDSEIFDALAKQFAVGDPKWDDRDLIKFMIEEAFSKSIGTFLEEKHGDRTAFHKLPKDFNRKGEPLTEDSVLSDVIAAEMITLQDYVTAAYNREKTDFEDKESLKSQFKNREIWANGKIEGDHAPFDLIVDLNLIEIVLFGSQAQWVDDVYHFTSDDEEDNGEGESDETDSIDPTEPDASTSSDVSTTDPTDLIDPTAEPTEEEPEYTCVANEALEALIGSEATSELTAGRKGSLEPGEIPVGCGNGRIENQEECDDGNLVAGDGCGVGCEVESCSSLDCVDPDVVTFTQLPDEVKKDVQIHSLTDSLAEDKEGVDIPIVCPPDSTALTQDELDALADSKKTERPQPPAYTPYAGGNLKNVPESNRPPCPPGNSTLQVTVAGKTSQTCIPTHLCADFDAARTLLFGEDYEDDPETNKLAASIEAMICVDVIKNLRPESPYSVNDGCVDCHILAMNDEMNELLAYNIAPLENNMQAWGLSNRWGPNFYLDLVVQVASKLHRASSTIFDSPLDDTMDAAKEAIQKANNQIDPNKQLLLPSLSVNTDALTLVQRKIEGDELAAAAIRNTLEANRITSDAEGDQSNHGAVMGLLNQMLQSFERLDASLVDTDVGTSFANKQECRF